MRRLELVLSVVLVLMASLSSPMAQEPGQAFTSEAIRCPVTLDVSETEGKTYHCGVVYVPENYDKPEGRVIELNYLVLHSTSLTSEPDPVVYLSGGPGGSALSEMANEGTHLRLGYHNIRERRDVVAFDQRGDRYSSMLFCSAIAQLVIGVPAEIGDRPEFQQFKAALDSVPEDQQYAVMQGICGRSLDILGTDITQYNSAVSVRDIAEVVSAAGYSGQYNLYGVSYGTRLALTAMRDAPDNIRSVVLDSTYPPEIQNYETVSTLIVEPYQQVFKMCREVAECAAAFPDIEARFITLLDRMAEAPLPVDPPIDVSGTAVGTYAFKGDTVSQIDASLFVNIATASNASPGGGWMPYIPALVHFLEQGDYQTAVDLLEGKLVPAVAKPIDTPELQRLSELQQTAAQTQGDIQQLLQQQIDDAAQLRPAAKWLAIVSDYLDKVKSADGSIDLATIELYWLPLEPQTAVSLSEFASDALDADTAAAANDVVAGMTTDDVRETFNAVRAIGIAGVGVETLTALGQQYAVECYEEVPFQDEGRAAETMAGLPYPGLFDPDNDAVAVLKKLCSLFEETGVKAPEIENERVTSTIPTLIYQGLIDTQTPASWGPSAAKGLPNSKLVFVANSGHSIMSKTDCAMSVSAHFLDHPEGDLNTSCIQMPMKFLTLDMIGR